MNRYHNLNIYGHIALELGADNTLSGSTQNSHNVPTADISFLRFTGTNPMISGFADGANNNKILIVSFVPDEGASGGVLTLKHESTYSLSGNRIKTNDGNDLVLNPFESAFLLYDSYDTVWRVVSSPSAAAGGNTFSSINITGAGVVFEGATANEFETTLTVTDPTADRTITLPNATTTVVGTDVSQTLTNKTISVDDNTVSGVAASSFVLSNSSGNIDGSAAQKAIPTGDVVGTSDSQTLTNKTLTTPVISSISNTGTLTLPTSTDTLVGRATSDTLSNKSIALGSNTVTGTLAQFNSALTDADFVSIAGSETLTNKTLTSPIINTPTGITKSDVGLGNVDNTSDVNKPISSATQTALDGKASLSGATFTGAINGTSLTLSGDLTVNGTTTNLNSTNLVIEDKNIVLGDVASPTNTTADGGGITLLGTTDKTLNWVNSTTSWTSSENFDLASGKTYRINGTTVLSSTQVLGKSVPTGDFVGTSDSQTLTNKTLTSPVISSISNTGTLTLPTSTDTLVGKATSDTFTNKSISLATNTVTGTLAQFNTALSDADFASLAGSETLTNKTISGANNTISNIGNASLTNSSISINGSSVSLGGSITVRSFTSANITTNTTVTAWTQNFVFTSNGAITVTLPASPSNGDRVRVIDADYGSAGTNITVARNGNKINNVADDLLIDINGAAVEFVYNTTATNWQIINTPI